MKFKYESAITTQAIQNCPPENFAECNGTMTLFNWCHSPFDPAKDFIPPGILKPSRLRRDRMSDDEICECMALSFYPSAADAIARYQLVITKDSLRELIGEYIASGNPDASAGVLGQQDSAPEMHGHMDFHEYAGIDLKLIFTPLTNKIP